MIKLPLEDWSDGVPSAHSSSAVLKFAAGISSHIAALAERGLP